MLSLVILVTLHECGHFFPAKWFKTRVEKFYLFFDPWFSLFKKKIGDTEYGIGWLPLGGYVKIAGMVDESFDTEKLKEEPKEWEFRSKKTWQRLIIMIGGVVVNFILGFLIFAFLIWIYGKSYMPMSEMKYGIAVDSFAYQMGFRDGDRILKQGGQTVERFDRAEMLKGIVLENKQNFELKRNGEIIQIQIPQNLVQELTKPSAKDLELWNIPMPAEAFKFFPGSAMEKAGFKVGDRCIEVDGQAVQFAHQVSKILNKRKNISLPIAVIRGQDTIRNEVKVGDDGRLGVYWPMMDKHYKVSHDQYSFLASLPLGVKEGWDLLSNQLKAFGKMFSGEIKAKDSLGGFASIANMFEKTWDWFSFWRMTAVLSIILGFMNLLPIPGLDGGHVVFLLVEMITGKKVPDSIVEKATLVGFVLLMGLMLYANGMDIFRILGK